MEKKYNFKEVEPQIISLWEKSNYFPPQIDPAKKPFSIFLTPPNASGPMHIGNAFMIAIQDILARYHRAKGDPTLWIPATDHGGYETQVTFEKNLETQGRDKSEFKKADLYQTVGEFVKKNNVFIKSQIKAMGASVDWSRFRFTMDEESLNSVLGTFKKMVADNLIYRAPYMVHYCPNCATILSDIELKEMKEDLPLYFIKCDIEGSGESISIATTRPEFIFSSTHVLIHPLDQMHRHLIGKTLINPVTGKKIEAVESKRKYDPKNPEKFLSFHSPSCDKYDYEYAIRNSIPSFNLLDWNGKLIDRYPGITPLEAREKEIAYLNKNGKIERTDKSHFDYKYLCKRGHVVENLISQTWFLKLDDEKVPLRKPAIEAVHRENLTVIPKWKEKGLLEWLGKMPDWPIARQNVWGIKIPVWYEVSNASLFMVWFIDKEGKRLFGNLKTFLDQGIALEEIENGLERLYASEGAVWTLEKENGREYLPETDSFDTWFSSGQWATIAFGDMNSEDFRYFYPNHSIVIGHDLLRLSVCRKILLSQYLTGRLPFKIVYLHKLLKGQDGQKMSKSLGNSVSLEYYLEKFGADVTRMAMISYTEEQEDFILSEDRLLFFKTFSERMWKMGRVAELANQNSLENFEVKLLRIEDRDLLEKVERLSSLISASLNRYYFADPEDKLCLFLLDLEKYVENMQTKKDISLPLSVFKSVFKKYILLLHPFMPFMTEKLNADLYNADPLLAETKWQN